LGNTGDVGILVGYENEGSVYRILRLRDRKLIKTRHAKFDESTFPKLSNDSVPFSMVEPLLDDEVDHDSFEADSEVSSVSSSSDCGLDTQDDLGRDATPPPSPVSVPVPSTIISSDILTSNILDSRRIRRPRAFATVVGDNIPNHYHQAVKGRESANWLEAVKVELEAMKRLKVWEVVDLLPTTKTVGTTWVFKKKHTEDKIVFKARLCAQGFSQVHGVDFSKTFAPTGRLNSL
jgi:hypothetical protein